MERTSDKISYTQIKICGLTTEEDIQLVNQLSVDYAGFVLFFPKSKRNLSVPEAKCLFDKLDSKIKKVAVTVSLTLTQLKEIEDAGFDYIQVHGELKEEVLNKAELPILRAINLSKQEDLDQIKHPISEKIIGFVVDGADAGSGKTFSWNSFLELRKTLPSDKLFFLAGGLQEDNVIEGIMTFSPDVIDVSSGVEFNDGTKGKDPIKTRNFVRKVKNNE